MANKAYRLDDEIRALLPAHSEEERATLRKLIEEGGHVDHGVIGKWDGDAALIDGYHRYDICEEMGLRFPTRVIHFASRELAIQWVIDNQLGRRNLTPELLAYYRGTEWLAKKASSGHEPSQLGDIAEKYGTSPGTIRRDGEFAAAVDAIGEEHGPEAKAAVLSGQAGITKEEVIEGKKPLICGNCNMFGIIPWCERCEELRQKEKERQKEERQRQDLQSGLAAAEKVEEKEPKAITIHEKIVSHNSEIEQWCRQLMNFCDTMPDGPWLQHENRRAGAIAKLRACAEQVRSAKCAEVHLPCNGEGCRGCYETGMLTKAAVEQGKQKATGEE